MWRQNLTRESDLENRITSKFRERVGVKLRLFNLREEIEARKRQSFEVTTIQHKHVVSKF